MTKQAITEAIEKFLAPTGWKKDRWGNLVKADGTRRIKFKELVFRDEKKIQINMADGTVETHWILGRSHYYSKCRVLENGKIKTA